MTVDPDNYQADFATNDAAKGERVADAINTLLCGVRSLRAVPPALKIASAYFNPGGFNLLADELEQVGPVQLLLGAEPTDIANGVKERPLAQRRSRRGPDPSLAKALEGYARSLEDDRDLLGFDREADASARRLVAWLKDHPGAEVRRYDEGFLHGKAFIVDAGGGVLAGSSNFTYAGLALNNELNLGQYHPPTVRTVSTWFNEQWDKSVPYDLAGLYEARWLDHPPFAVFLRMLFEKYGTDLSEATKGSNLGLTNFQADGVWRAKRILERRHGVLIADEVGLGKTFLAGELIYEAVFERRQKVLIVCPATLRDTTWEPFLALHNMRADVLSFEQLVADLESAGEQSSALQALDEYAMVIVDEAHAFRNDATKRAAALHRVLKGTVPKDLVLLTATPVNNSLEDLYALVMYFAGTDAAFADVGIPSLRQYFNRAMAMNPDDLSAEHLFDVLDAVAVRRTRRFVKTHYAGDKVTINGIEQTIVFPTARVKRVDYNLNTVLPGIFDHLATALGADVDEEAMGAVIGAGVILGDPDVLTMARYVPSKFRIDGETERYEAQNAGLLRSGLLKRFESSGYAFSRTVTKMIESHNRFLHALDAGLVLTGDTLRAWTVADTDDVEDFLDNTDDDEHVADAADYNVTELRAAVVADRDLLTKFKERVETINASNDPKIFALIEELATIAAEAAAEGIGEEGTHGARNKRKTLVFTYYADTASYLEAALKDALLTDPRLAAFHDRFEMVAGPNKDHRTDIITGFAPMTAGTGVEEDIYDLLVTTDVLAEGVNLQQARHIINYDLPWNPMRLVQRHGRIDRIGSPHREVFMRCFFPDEDLDRILGLEERLNRKIKQAAAAVGHSEILPGIDPVERSITETRDLIDQIRHEEATLFEIGGNGAISGEEYRRKLSNVFQNSPEYKTLVLALPWGSGSGFVRPSADHGFVFCARVGDHHDPIYRYIPLDENLTPQRHTPVVMGTVDPHSPQATGQEETPAQVHDLTVPVVIRETLSCLAHADPGPDTTPRHLPEETYQAAFAAWAIAKNDILEDWTRQTDIAQFQVPIPRVMRDAVNLVDQHGAGLGQAQDELSERLRVDPPPRVKRQIRDSLDADATAAEIVTMIAAIADEHGLTRPLPPEPLPPITADDINLVCWVAISPT